MATVEGQSTLVRTVLSNIARHYRVADVRTLPIFDEETGNYLLLDEGWNGYKRTHQVWAHVEARDGKYHIHEDGTQEGVATHLIQAGVPMERIVMEIDAPS